MKQPAAKRLAYLVSQYPAISHTFILREVGELRRHGLEIQVASVNPADRPQAQLTEQERQEKAGTYCIKQAGVAGAAASLLAMAYRRPFGCARALVEALRLAGPHLLQLAKHLCYFVEAAMVAHWMERRRLRHLHVHFATQAATVGVLTAQIAPIRLSITVHGPDEFYDVTRYRLSEKIKAAARLCAISSFARSQLMKLAAAPEWNKIALTPLGIDPDQFRPEVSREPKSDGKRPGCFEILCVGRLVPAKGQQILLGAVDLLRGRGLNVHLTLVGDGPDRRVLERAARERRLESTVEFAGAVNQERIGEFYRRAHVFALASFAEGVPVVLMEAMAMEIPCVSTWVAGIPELIRPGIDGLLVPPSDENALAAALEQLCRDQDLRRRLGSAGRARVENKYNLETNVSRLAGVFAEFWKEAA